MDLSFPRPLAAGDASLPPADMAWLVATLTQRLGVTATALAQAAIERAPLSLSPPPPLLAPVGGAFNGAMAARLTDWKHA